MATTVKTKVPVKKATVGVTKPTTTNKGKPSAAAEADNDHHLNLDEKLVAQVVKARGTPDNVKLKWDEVADALNIHPGRAMLMYMWGTLPDKERVSGPYAKRAEAIVKLRAQDKSWGQISAITDIPESRVRAEWAERTGQSDRGQRLEGRGGRRPNGDEPQPRPTAKKVAVPAKKIVQKADKAWKDMTVAELKTKLNGAGVMVKGEDGRNQQIAVGEVKRLANGKVTVTDLQTNTNRTFPVEAIMRVGKAQAKAS